jgi:hypothetical protein
MPLPVAPDYPALGHYQSELSALSVHVRVPQHWLMLEGRDVCGYSEAIVVQDF